MQSYKNHTRYDPPMHFALLPFGMLMVLASGYFAYERRLPEDFLLMALSVGFFGLSYKTRKYLTKTQDRIVRTEEQFRLYRLGVDASKLSMEQLIALRFAPDAELPGLAERASRESLSPDRIMQSIKVWRPDEHRV